MRAAAVLLIVVAASAALAASPEGPDLRSPIVGKVLQGFDPDALEGHVRFLADDLLEGRGTATRGHEIAARYMASHFAALDLSPGVGGGWFQEVPLRRSDLVRAQSSVSLLRGTRGQTLEYGTHYTMGGDFLRDRVSVRAAVVYAGFGVHAPELGYDDYQGLDVRGKIVLIAQGAPKTFPNDQRAYHSSNTLKEENAAARGAVGVMVFRTPAEEARAPWPKAVVQSKLSRFRWLEPNRAPHDVEPGMRGHCVLSRAGVAAVLAGGPEPLTRVDQALEEGKPRRFALPLEARITTVSRRADVASPNVVALLRGSDPKLRNEYVVYTAHLDHLGISEPVRGDSINNGAYDNAGGCGGLIEIARAFTRLPKPPRRSILFVAVTAEEKGLLGSSYFAHRPTVPIASIVADVNMDMFLMLFPFRDLVAFGAEHSSLGPVVERAAERLGLGVSPDPRPEQVIFIRSDQFSFVKQGVPSVFLVDGNQSSVPAAEASRRRAEWHRTVYHTPADQLGQPMDFAAGNRLVQAAFLVGYVVAEADGRPTWNRGDFFGERFGRTRVAGTAARR